MNIGILTITNKESGGVYQYTLALLEAIKRSGEQFNYIQITTEKFPKVLSNCIVLKTRNSGLLLKAKLVLYSSLGIKIGNLFGSNNLSELKNIDCIVSPTVTLLLSCMQRPYIVTIHDFQYKYYPQFFTLWERFLINITYRTGKKSKIVVCESNFVKNDLINFLSIKNDKIRVLPSPPFFYTERSEIQADLLSSVQDKYDLPSKYLFYPSQFWFHKNHIKLVQALKLLKEEYGFCIPLVLVGSKNNNFGNTMNEIKRLEIEDQVKYLGYVPDGDLRCLYKLATALIVPTLFESVSLPIWEAFYFGCPVVSSNVCALPEQVGDAGLLFDPNNAGDIAEKIYMIWSDGKLRQELVGKGNERVKDLTLKNYARQWGEIIEEVLGDRKMK
jgi:glycosyltransferase involved in cell wall biosynthesis